MSINLGACALVSGLALAGAATGQHFGQQYGKPAGPQQHAVYGTTSTAPGTGALDCATLMAHHRQMTAELDKMDEYAATLVLQMRDAKSDRARLEATMGVVETLVTQRKQIRRRMSTMEHETLQFMLSTKGTDLMSSCPQITEWLRQGAMSGATTDDEEEQGGPDDLELER